MYIKPKPVASLNSANYNKAIILKKNQFKIGSSHIYN